ncbi:hypothetical protein PENSPDRAFT_751080 [Peniophora sp. CONT]|nr:hypothetical protein PENSPDRAFT_751080 [Peniophora sp. CONT]
MLKANSETDSYRQSAEDAWSAFIRTRFGAGHGPLGRSGRATRLPQLEVEFETMQKFFAVAKQHMNACTGAGCLPTEILATIVSLAQESWPAKSVHHLSLREDTDDEVVTYDLGWMNITQVCSRWRKATLGNPALWQTVHCLGLPLPLATDILSRSSRLPLRLYIGDGVHDISNDVITNWMSWPVLRRTSLLHIDDTSYDDDVNYERWFSAITQPMPILEDLSISFNLDGSVTLLPNNLWVESPPALTSLQLSNCFLPNWNSPVLGDKVTHLCLELNWCYEEQEASPTTMEMRNLFSRLTSLKLLTLSNFWPKKDTPPPDPFEFYHGLEIFDSDFSMDGMFETHYSYFWALFRVPSTTTLYVNGYNDWGEDGDDHPGLVDPITQVDNATSPALGLVVDDFLVKLYYAETPLLAHSPPPKHIFTDAHSDRSRSCRTLKCKNSAAQFLIHLLPLESLRIISITAPAMKRITALEPGRGWLLKFGPARNVRRLDVYYAHSLALLDDLAKKDANEGFPLFPLLDSLVFHHDPKATANSVQTSLDLMLLELLAIRHEQSAGIQELMVDWRMESWSVWSQVNQDTTKVLFFEP